MSRSIRNEKSACCISMVMSARIVTPGRYRVEKAAPRLEAAAHKIDRRRLHVHRHMHEDRRAQNSIKLSVERDVAIRQST